MKRTLSTRARAFLASLILLSGPLANAAAHDPAPGPHELPLDLTGEEYRRLLEARPPTARAGDLAPALAAGKRNLDWLALINRSRPVDQKLSFSSPETQHGYPVDKPMEYNVAIVSTRFQIAARDMPAAMRAVLVDGAAASPLPPTDVATYLKWGREVDTCYQLAARWQMMSPMLGELAGRRWRDVRGYVYLQNLADRDRKLQNLNAQPAAERASIAEALAMLCSNSGASMASCRSSLQSAAGATGNATAFYARWLPSGASVYRGFFDIARSSLRTDITWPDANTLRVPFVDPGNAAQKTFLLNIEDEWRLAPWRLTLGFRGYAPGVPHVRFEPGVTPHVNGLGGNEITMDSNAPLTEYDVRWTIRHEFGHVLGFPDCYHEFYDGDRGAIVSYQIDVTDLMCSRQGRINRRLQQTLRQMY